MVAQATRGTRTHPNGMLQGVSNEVMNRDFTSICVQYVCVARAMETRSILQARAFIYWQVSGQLLIVKHDLFRCYRINALVAGWADAVSVLSVCVYVSSSPCQRWPRLLVTGRPGI